MMKTDESGKLAGFTNETAVETRVVDADNGASSVIAHQ